MSTWCVFGAEEAEVAAEGTSSVAAEEMVEQTPPPKVVAEHEDDDRADDDVEGSDDDEGNEPDDEDDAEEDDAEDSPSKPSHLNFGVSSIMERSFEGYKKKGYLTDPKRCRAGGSDTTPDPKDGEIVLFECFFN